MFAVVKFADFQEGLFKRMLSHFGKKKVFTEKVSVAPGVFYFLLDCNFPYERADWEMIIRCAGGAKSRIILPENVKAPEGFPKCTFKKLRKRAFILTALEILKKEKCESITIDDRDGNYINDIEKFVPLSSLIRVVTNKPERYEGLREKIMDEFGASFLTSDENSDLGRTWLATYSGGVWHGEGIKAVTAADVCFGAEKLIRLSELEFDEKYLSLVPPRIDSEKFLSALYECSHAAFLENTFFSCDRIGRA